MPHVEAIERRLLCATLGPRDVPAPPIPGNWSLTLADEFNGTSLGAVWTPHQYWANGPTMGQGLEESDPSNVAVGNGTLQLTARVDNSFGTQYTGALVQTGGIADNPSVPTFSFLYGYAEARIQIPAGAGFWPALWMLPASHNDENGEIDVMEVYDQNTTIVHGTVHRFGAQQQYSYHTGTDLSVGWHTYGVDWEPDHITWFVDGTAYATTTAQGMIPNEPMFPILDLGVGGDGNAPTASTPFPGVMSVDYVHVWQQPAAPAVTINPASLSVPAGRTAAFTAVSSGYPVPTVQWQVSTDGGKTFSDMSGATSTTLSFAVAEAQNGYEYRAVFTNSLGAATTIPATLTVTTPVTLSAAGPNPSSAMQELSFTATVGGGVADGEQVLLEDASNANQVVATGTLANGSATLTIPAGTLAPGTHSLVAVYGGDATFAAGQSAPYAQTVQPPPALIGAPVINGDNPNGLFTAAGQGAIPGVQRSMVEDVVYTFNEPVIINNANPAFTVAVAGSMGTVPSTLIATAVPGTNATQWAVSLTGQPDGVLASIANGEYSITISAGFVFAAADGVTPMAPGAGRTDYFYRLFGDINGDRIINAADNLQFKKAMIRYNPVFDSNADGTVNAADNLQFKRYQALNYFSDGFVTTI